MEEIYKSCKSDKFYLKLRDKSKHSRNLNKYETLILLWILQDK